MSDDEDDEEDEDIALSDLESVASDDKGDIIPHQRLTINNTAALLRAVKSFALSSKLPFSENQVIISDAPTDIPDMEDDLNRELAFYKQSLDAVTKARGLLKKEGVPFSRPADYFAEMVKSDEHMGKIKGKLIDEAASKKASAEARRQRDLKKFGKQVQVAKLQERSREKKDTMDKIQLLKRSKSTYVSHTSYLQRLTTHKNREKGRRHWQRKRRRHVRCRTRGRCRDRKEGQGRSQGRWCL
jgi:rRNA-processing protein EBP2